MTSNRVLRSDELLQPLWEGFETEDDARREDLGRAASLAKCARDEEGKGNAIAGSMLAASELRDLSDRLAKGVETGVPPRTLASSMYMRPVRHIAIEAMLRAFEPYPDLVTTTVIKGSWLMRPEDLLKVSLKQLKNQFQSDLRRTGVADHPDPLVGWFHGEFEPTSGAMQLHVHTGTTEEKAAVLRSNLRELGAYQFTATGAPAIRRSQVRDPARQLSYLIKSYWPQKTVRLIEGTAKRDRDHHRIREPEHSLVLVWLDRQRLRDLTITNRTWSPRLGGSEAWRDFYLLLRALE